MLTPRAPTRVAILAVLLGLFAGTMAFAPLRADGPVELNGPFATRTVTWALTDPATLEMENATIESGGIVLPWRDDARAVAGGDELWSLGYPASELEATPEGVELREDRSNHVPNGDFREDAWWTYAPSPRGNVSVAWNASDGSAVFAHASPSTRVPFDSMDVLDSNWSRWIPFCADLFMSPSDVGQVEGTGMLNLSVRTDPGSRCNPGVVRQGFVDWSAYDRLSLVIKLWSERNLTFYVSAIEGTLLSNSTRQPLAGTGWRTLEVDLEELGSPRTSLSSVTLHLEGESVPWTNVSIDDLRVGRVKRFAETAETAQDVEKTEATWNFPGSAILSFKWRVDDVDGVTADLHVLLEGPQGGLRVGIPLVGRSNWESSERDVSESTPASGTYRLSFMVAVASNTSAATTAAVRIDDINLRFPNRHNATYSTTAFDLATRSRVDNVTWAASLPGATSARMRVFGTLKADPQTTDWALLGESEAPGTLDLGELTAVRVRIEVDLRTLNASASPRLEALEIGFRHRAERGTVTSQPFLARTDFLFWRTVQVTWSLRPGTSITLEVENGTSWNPTPPQSDLTWHTSRGIRARATLATSDTTESPKLVALSLVYDYLAEVVAVVITPGEAEVVSGRSVTLAAQAVDAGGHANRSLSIDWDTDNRGGYVTNAGVFTAGEPGDWTVTATVRGLGVYSTIPVRVLPAGLFPAELPFLPYVLVTLAAVAGGLVLYRVVAQRLYAVDDIFVISRDGRLIMHNTRRMRADRDEDILAGMLTAISAFVRDSFREENGDLRRFDMEGKAALVERGRDVFVAAIYTGRIPAWAGKDLRRLLADVESLFGERLRRWTGAPEELQGIKELTDRFVARARYRNGAGRAVRPS